MSSFIGSTEVIGIFGESLVPPDWIEISLSQGVLCRGDLSNGLWIRTDNFVGHDSKKCPVLPMKSSLNFVHVPFQHMIYDP